MNKEKFLEALENRLTGLPWTDVKTSLDFYSEMIDDYIEDGMTEEEAVRAMGSVDEVTERILSDIPITKLVTASVKPKRSLAAWEIVLLILGAPIWLTVLFVIAGMIITVYAVIWAMVIAAYSVALALAASGIACVAAGVFRLLPQRAAGGAVYRSGTYMRGTCDIRGDALCPRYKGRDTAQPRHRPMDEVDFYQRGNDR
jgi:uncharacterized membrane protein